MTETDNKIEWDLEYSVNVDEIDNHQKKIFELFNQLIDMKEGKIDPREIANMISEINDYAKIYFSSEEKILRKKGYPDFDIHTKAHRQFIKSCISLRREMAEDVNNITLEMLLELRNWLVNHIKTADTLYVPFLRIHQFIDDANHKN